jgi:hypothetical protein
MTNETEKNACCAAKTACDDKAEKKSCCDAKAGCGNKKCLCGKTNCACKIFCRVFGIVLIAGLAWYSWQMQSTVNAVCGALSAAEKTHAIAAPEESMQAEVDELQEKVVENAREQNSIEGQYIAHLQAALASVRGVAGCP